MNLYGCIIQFFLKMTKTESRNCRPFDQLFAKNVPHIMENIFLSLDFESFKKCLRVSSAWNELLTSESFLMRAKNVFQAEILECERDLWEGGSIRRFRGQLHASLAFENQSFRAEKRCFWPPRRGSWGLTTSCAVALPSTPEKIACLLFLVTT